jgi:hypothetical protein
VKQGKDATRKAFELTLDLCALFCSVKHPELNKEWFKNNSDPTQIQLFADTIKDTLQRSYNIVEKYGEADGKN